jgi:hypothetical protein
MSRNEENQRVSAAREETEAQVRQQEIIELEQKHARGYEKQPQMVEEVGEWEEEQVWDVFADFSGI